MSGGSCEQLAWFRRTTRWRVGRSRVGSPAAESAIRPVDALPQGVVRPVPTQDSIPVDREIPIRSGLHRTLEIGTATLARWNTQVAER